MRIIPCEESRSSLTWAGTIGFVQANGNFGNYHFTDGALLTGKNYYRLKIIDNQASQSYSRIQFIDFSKKGYLELTPSPILEKITQKIKKQ